MSVVIVVVLSKLKLDALERRNNNNNNSNNGNSRPNLSCSSPERLYVASRDAIKPPTVVDDNWSYIEIRLGAARYVAHETIAPLCEQHNLCARVYRISFILKSAHVI